jgi:MarR family transcriptional regulator, lower aerobic nicotinate degradation pathway regulator
LEKDTLAATELGNEATGLPMACSEWPLAARPGFLIRRLHQAHVALFHELVGGLGVTPVQYSLLSAIAARGRADQTTLAADVALDRSTTAATLARLHKRGLIGRARDPGDARAMLCVLTPVGLDLLRHIEPLARQAHARTLAGLSQTDAAILVGLLRRALV